MASVRFPETAQEEPANYFFDHAVVMGKFDEPNRLRNPGGIAINTTNNDIYVVEEKRYIFVFSETGTFKDKHRLEHTERVWGIAIHGDRVYLTDVKLDEVFCYKIGIGGFHLVARLGRRGFYLGQFHCPCQLDISTNGDVYIADSCNNRIQILNNSLHPIRELKHSSLFRLTDLKLIEHEIYVLSPFTALCVHVFSYSGEKIRSLITNDVRRRMINDSNAFYVDANKNIIISESHAHQIKFFSNEGVHLHTLEILGHYDRDHHISDWSTFHKTTGIALISQDKLVITTKEKSGLIQMFSFNK